VNVHPEKQRKALRTLLSLAILNLYDFDPIRIETVKSVKEEADFPCIKEKRDC